MSELLHAWDSYYVIVGSSAAALTGLMFVVVTLMPTLRRGAGATENTVAAFATPTIVYFCAALLVSAILSAPWSNLRQAGWTVGASGVFGLFYTGIVGRRVFKTAEYRAEIVDWVWYVILPASAYIVLVVAGFLFDEQDAGAMYPIGAATLGLLFIGIHNAWDSVTYITLRAREEEAMESPQPAPKHDNKRHK
jgi:hypothetical protein